MRFHSPTRTALPDRESCDSVATWETAIRYCFAGLLGIGLVLVGQFGWTQPPGTPPPGPLFDLGSSGGTSLDGGLEIKGFLMLDESGVGVMVPQMTYERWHELESGLGGVHQLFAFQSLDINGRATLGRAELQVTLRFTVDATDGRRIPIPLRMGNFHCLSPPDVNGVDEHSMTVAPDNGGYVLWVRAEKRREAILRMKVSARVDTGTTSSLQFRMPDVPSAVQLDVPGEQITTEVVGRGDEVLQTTKLPGALSRLKVESGGGTFVLRWGSVRRQDDTSPQFEVDSRVDVRWVAPEDQPTASVELVIRNLRGSVAQFDVRLPPGAVLLDTPLLGSSGQFIDVSLESTTNTTQPLRITIPENEQQQRIDLQLELQLANTQASATAPLILQIPEVLGAIRQRGEVHVQTGADYRLRWLSRQWIRSLANDGVKELGSHRRYSFRFDRGGLSLPIYLSAKQRRVRLTSNSEITISKSLAVLEMTVNALGQTNDARSLNLDLQDWRLRSIVDIESGEELESYGADRFQEIEMNSGTAEESAPIRIVAEREIPSEPQVFQLPLPQIIKVDENQVIQTSTVVVRSAGRTVFVLDLSRSSGLDRLTNNAELGPMQPNVHRFRVLPPDAPATIAGMMVWQPPRIDLTSEASVQLDAGQLRTTIDWTITSLTDLEGRLPIEIPSLAVPPTAVGGPVAESSGRSPSAGTESSSDTSSDESAPENERISAVVDPAEDSEELKQWTVFVNDSAAVLRHLEGTRYELISDRLSSGSIAVRWWNNQSVATQPSVETLRWIVLPRPTVADVSMQSSVHIALAGDQFTELRGPGMDSEIGLWLDSLPREPLRLRMVPRAALGREFSIERAVLRTAVGRQVRHEQFLATVVGGEQMTIGLPTGLGEITAEALVDGQSVAVIRNRDQLQLALPLSAERHHVDLRVWVNQPPGAWFPEVRPILRVPDGIGRVYWQVVSPLDAHLLWAAPTLGRVMDWKFERWRLAREPLRNDSTLLEWVGIEEPLAMPPGNRYLYVGTEPGSFSAVLATRALLWSVVAALVLMVAAVLTYVPRSRHPITAVLAAIVLAGLIAIAPDAAVLIGQFSMIALVLVIVMTSIRALMSPRQTKPRVFQPGRSSGEPSSRAIPPASPNHGSQMSATASLPVASTDPDPGVKNGKDQLAEPLGTASSVSSGFVPSSGERPPGSEVPS